MCTILGEASTVSVELSMWKTRHMLPETKDENKARTGLKRCLLIIQQNSIFPPKLYFRFVGYYICKSTNVMFVLGIFVTFRQFKNSFQVYSFVNLTLIKLSYFENSLSLIFVIKDGSQYGNALQWNLRLQHQWKVARINLKM